uniref:Uncharacterized protein n=1 Tax=Candidatus Kentrum sp. LPFa TaxID=2126335 RepID=A0A450XFZ4_9GAMM|nr:MAG: hypothetical protein BECKLPF1236A_GA0070988_100596 [Candidatus Kentron sp. LPFa]VFK28222.1 MAG: hypothetical protein BECKLPF1236C_GA0070990_100616 [Candidatus Kentron sp. LPFa]
MAIANAAAANALPNFIFICLLLNSALRQDRNGIGLGIGAGSSGILALSKPYITLCRLDAKLFSLLLLLQNSLRSYPTSDFTYHSLYRAPRPGEGASQAEGNSPDLLINYVV